MTATWEQPFEMWPGLRVGDGIEGTEMTLLPRRAPVLMSESLKTSLPAHRAKNVLDNDEVTGMVVIRDGDLHPDLHNPS